MGPRRIIATDIDGVLADFNKGFTRWHNLRYGTNIRRDEVDDYELQRVFGIDYHQMQRRIDLFLTHQAWNLPALPKSGATIRALARNYEILAITAREHKHHMTTRAWMDVKFPDIKEIWYADQRSGDSEMTKGELCDKMGVYRLIEDNLDIANRVQDTEVYLLDQHWNRGDLNKNVTRVFSWVDIRRRLR